MNSDDLARLSFIDQRKREIKDEEKSLNAERRDLEERLLKEFESIGMQNAKINGVTIYIHRQLWAKARDGNAEPAIEAMKANGLHEFIKESFNTNTVSAWVREQESLGEAIPQDVADTLNISEVFSLRTRKG